VSNRRAELQEYLEKAEINLLTTRDQPATIAVGQGDK
jgi:hypothetical protein